MRKARFTGWRVCLLVGMLLSLALPPALLAQDVAAPPAGEATPPPPAASTDGSPQQNPALYLPLIHNGMDQDDTSPQEPLVEVAEAVLGEEPPAAIQEKPATDAQTDGAVQPAPEPGQETPVLEAEDAKTLDAVPEEMESAAVDGWTTVMSQNFEGTFPSGSWRVLDANGSSYGEYYWDDDNYRPYSGGWSAWAANGGRTLSTHATPPTLTICVLG